jgi:hypothetical protein
MKVSAILISSLLACTSVFSLSLSGSARQQMIKDSAPDSNSIVQAIPSSPVSDPATAAPSTDGSKPASSFPMETPTTPSTRTQSPIVGGADLTKSDASKKVLVNCGSSGAASVRESDAVPVGCRVSNTSTLPGAALKN